MVTEEQALELAMQLLTGYIEQCGASTLQDVEQAAAIMVGAAMGLASAANNPSVNFMRLQ